MSRTLPEAEERGLRQEPEAEFPLETPELVGAPFHCDMTAGPDGTPTTTPARIAEIAGNRTVRAGRILRALFTADVDLIGTSDDRGASKPDPGFFEKVAEVVPAEPGEILYVGDRLDNDMLPALSAGMRTALIRRGPWGWIQQHDAAADRSTFRIDSLLELPELITKFNASAAAS